MKKLFNPRKKRRLKGWDVLSRVALYGMVWEILAILKAKENIECK